MSIEAMKLALEALEKADKIRGFPNNKKAITSLRQAIEQAQEPVAWRFQSAVGGWAYGKEPPIGSKYAVEPLYTSPPQRQPLSDEELKKTWYDMKNIMGWYSFQEIARAIEAAHGIKE